jgi:hypothetical protein
MNVLEYQIVKDSLLKWKVKNCSFDQRVHIWKVKTSVGQFLSFDPGNQQGLGLGSNNLPACC